jgi:hypothetical protein
LIPTFAFIFIETAGSTTLINSGSFIVKNSLWSQIFLQQWWNYSNRQLFSDQEQFDLLYSSNKYTIEEKKKKITILNGNHINSDPPAMTKQLPSNQVLHLMVS